MELSIVVPCYNEEEVLPHTARRLVELLQRLESLGKIDSGSTIYFVDDGSRDSTWQIIENLAGEEQRVHGVKLSRNRGHQIALIAGLQAAGGDAVVSIDADLQDDVDVIEAMVDRYREGYEVVYGVRDNRDADSFLKRLTAQSYYTLLRLMGVDIVFNHADYRLLSRRALRCLESYREVNLFLRGIMPLLGFRSTEVAYTRVERFAGESKYSLRKMLALALDGVTSFSAFPLRMITMIGLVVFALSSAMGLWALWAHLFGVATVPGWTSTVVPVYLLGGVQLLCIGIIGEYLSKIYLEVKQRPRYFIEKLV
jgi:polyisoprenyl-phosphate glycosyltransferase